MVAWGRGVGPKLTSRMRAVGSSCAALRYPQGRSLVPRDLPTAENEASPPWNLHLPG